MNTVTSKGITVVKHFSTTIIVGAGQAGLAMSRELTVRNIDHCLLERGRIGQSWRDRRWKSLRLQTPNWANGLPAVADPDPDPDGFLLASAFAERLDRYAGLISAPAQEGCEVFAAQVHERGFELATNRGEFVCEALVVATGACASPLVPPIAKTLQDNLLQLTASNYQRPEKLPEGGVLVVGASASGVQIATELQASDRQVILATGNHLRLPRSYRGRDIEWWLEAIGSLDERFDEVDDLLRVRQTPSPQLTGWPQKVDIGALQDRGVEIVGRLTGVRDDVLLFSGGIAHVCMVADLKLSRLCRRIDDWAASNLPSAVFPPAEALKPTPVPQDPRLKLDLNSGEIRTIVWATGYRPDYSWLRLPVFDKHRGQLDHHGGVVTSAPGLYVLGLPFQRRRRSALISGAGPDAHDIAEHLVAGLRSRLAA